MKYKFFFVDCQEVEEKTRSLLPPKREDCLCDKGGWVGVLAQEEVPGQARQDN